MCFSRCVNQQAKDKSHICSPWFKGFVVQMPHRYSNGPVTGIVQQDLEKEMQRAI